MKDKYKEQLILTRFSFSITNDISTNGAHRPVRSLQTKAKETNRGDDTIKNIETININCVN